MANQYELIHIPSEVRSQLASPLSAPPGIPLPPARVSAEFNWRNFFRILRRHWRPSLFFTLAFFISLVAVALLMEDTYEARARIEIEPLLLPATLTLRESSNLGMNEQDYFQTQIEILKSDALALVVIKTLHLDQESEFVGKPVQRSWRQAVFSNLLLDRIFKSSKKTPTEIALNSFRYRLTAEQLRNSRLVEVKFTSRHPQTAASVTNTLVGLYLERSYRVRYEATMKAAESLFGELEELRNGVRTANQTLVEFQNANGILEFSEAEGPAGSAGVRQNAVTLRVAELNRQLNLAQAERIQQESYVKLIQFGNADSLPQMRDNLILQDFTKRYVEARAQLAQALAIFGQNNPNAKKLQSQTDELGTQLGLARQRIIDQVKTGYQAAVTRERLLMQALSEMKDSVNRMNERMVRYQQLKREAQAASELYLNVSSRLKEAALSGSLNASNIRVVDQARIPERPAKPNRLQIISLGGVFGILMGVGLAFLREGMDDTIRSHEDIRAWTGLPSLAMFPLIGAPNADHRNRFSLRPARLLGNGGKSLENTFRLRFFLERPHSPEAEAVRSLVTSIRMPTRPGANPVRVILVVSPFQNEGKTTVAVNLAAALAQHGKTCLIDADLRNPMVARTFGLSFQRGLQDVLTNSVPLKEALRTAPNVPNLTILPANAATPNPGELVASEQMSEVLRGVREGFSYVVVDSPPIIPYADGRWLSSLVDGVVIVARSGLTTRQAMVWSTEILEDVRAPVLGVVLNGVDLDDEYYGYGQYRYTEDSRRA